MSFFKRVSIEDNVSLRTNYIDFQRNLRVAQVTRLCGVNFVGTTFDTNFWTASNTGTGSQTQVDGMITLATGATANSSSKFQSVRSARFLFACPNIYRRAGRFLDTGTTNNKRKFGCFNNTTGDGYFFQLSGTTFSIGYTKATSETLVNSGSFNGSVASWTVDTNVHSFEIHYFVMKIEFYIDGVLIHTLTPTTATFVGNITLPIFEENTNSGGSTSDVSMECWNASILRMGYEEHAPITKNISGAATTVCKRGSGKLHELSINSAVNGTITIYDNTAASGTILGTITTNNNSINAYDLNWVFSVGLTIVTSAAGHDITVNLE